MDIEEFAGWIMLALVVVAVAIWVAGIIMGTDLAGGVRAATSCGGVC